MNELTEYNNFFREIINTINSARYQAFKSLNRFHIGQNFEIGRIIVNIHNNIWDVNSPFQIDIVEINVIHILGHYGQADNNRNQEIKYE